MDVREAIHTQPMKPFQIGAIAICIIIAMVDGYDILVMAFVAPFLAKVWSIGPVQVGYLLSAGVFGAALGAVFVSPFADKVGRRRHTIVCLSLITLGMAASVVAQDIYQMIATRAFTGLWMGGVVASLNIIASEFSSDKRRGTVMGIYGIGAPGGVAVGGTITSALIDMGGWRAPLIFATVVSAAVLILVVVALPESIEFLVEKRPAWALEAYNKIGTKLGFEPATQLPPPRTTTVRKGAAAAIFSGLMLRRTVFLWLGFASLIAAFYFANTWTAKLISEATGDANMGVRAGTLVAVGGVIGAFLFAALCLTMRPRLATALIMFCGAASFVLYAHNFAAGGLALVLAVAVGACANGGLAAFFGISPSIYPAAVRATGVGLMIGFGRGVAIISPIFAGYMLSAGWTPAGVYQLFAGLFIVAGIATLMLDLTYRGLSEDPETPDARARPDEKPVSIKPLASH